MLFVNRHEAGKQLAAKLQPYKKYNPLILGIARGGVEVAYEIAKELQAPLDTLIVRKIGAPGNPEFGIGAISENGIEYVDKQVIEHHRINPQEVEQVKREEAAEISRRKMLYRNGKELPNLKNKVVIIVDDGLATGVTARVAIAAVKKLKPQRIIYAVPVASTEVSTGITRSIDDFVCLHIPIDMVAIGNFYEQFAQTSDEEVIHLLKISDEINLKHF